jgi:hypothetical protein
MKCYMFFLQYLVSLSHRCGGLVSEYHINRLTRKHVVLHLYSLRVVKCSQTELLTTQGVLLRKKAGQTVIMYH